MNIRSRGDAKRSEVLEGSADGPDFAEVVGTSAKADGEGVLLRSSGVQARNQEMNSSTTGAWVAEGAAVGKADCVVWCDGREKLCDVPVALRPLRVVPIAGAAKRGPAAAWGGSPFPFDFSDDGQAASGAVEVKSSSGGQRTEEVPPLSPDDPAEQDESAREKRGGGREGKGKELRWRDIRDE